MAVISLLREIPFPRWAALGLLVIPLLRGQTLQIVGDAHVNTAYPAVNFGSSVYLTVGGTSTSYLQFDLSSLPAGTNVANVTKVNLILFVNRIAAPGTIQVAEAAGAWTESAIVASNAPGGGRGARRYHTAGESGLRVDRCHQ